MPPVAPTFAASPAGPSPDTPKDPAYTPPPEPSFRPAGESWVWFTSMGLAIGLVMILGLLGLIISNGLAVFWPKPVVQVQLVEGSQAGIRGSPTFGGEHVKTQEKRVTQLDEDGKPLPPAYEYQFYVANRDAYGFSFKYIDRKEVLAITHPANAIVAERFSLGTAIFLPRELRPFESAAIPGDSPEFIPTLERLVQAGNERRREIRQIERHQIGAINRELSRLHLQRRALEHGPNPPADAPARLAAIDARAATLQAEFEGLAARARQLRERQAADTLSYVTLSGAERVTPVAEILDFTLPNQLGFFGKLREFVVRFWKFLSEEPRAANMEGGIFPAIFGTFVMTLLMSVAVTPFGVLAAIYLREYAKQGLFVRCVRIAVNNLAGVPSIVFGVFGLGFFVYMVGGSIDQLFFSLSLPTPTFGTGGVLWASATLALMTVPVVIVSTEEALAAVSRGSREGSLACGASKWQTIQRIVLPASLPGILTGLILAMARGAGEVAPLMLVGVVKLAPTLPIDGIPPFVHLERKFMHLGFHIFDLGFQSPDSEAAKPMVFATTFLLILLVVCLNLGAILIRNHLRKKYKVSTF